MLKACGMCCAALQHFLGPLDSGRYELEFLAMNAQTGDPSSPEKVRH